MEDSKLELKDIAGYLHGLKVKVYNDTILFEWHYDDEIFVEGNGCKIKPILRPLSDLYRTIAHNGEEIIPLIECAKKAHTTWNHNYKKIGEWKINEKTLLPRARFEDLDFTFDFGGFEFTENTSDYSFKKWVVKNQYQLFDYLHELKIDYRGLIDAGLAIDCNTLGEDNPYK